ncbi:MAG: alpha/beta hydrolase family protein [Nocardioidaceae bacterium]
MDDRVASAIAHWGPRFITNGVTASDFARVTAGLEHWENWCQAWSRVAAEHEALGRTALREGRTVSAGGHLAQAAVYYHFAKFVFVDDLDQMRAAHGHAVTCLTDALPHLTPVGRRVEFDFENTRLAAILRTPADGGPHPAVILLSGLDSTKEELRTTEETFIARGVATFSVDGPGQGEAEYDLPIRADWSAPADAIIEVLSAQPGIDPDRVGVWGVSLGGYYAPRVAAALGRRIKACVALAGPFDFGQTWPQLPTLTRRTFQVRSAASTDAEAERIAHTLSLEDQAHRITAPLLIVFGRQDRLIPWRQAERLAETTGGDVKLLMLEDGNHGCANIAPWHRPYTADWVADKLSVRP